MKIGDWVRVTNENHPHYWVVGKIVAEYTSLWTIRKNRLMGWYLRVEELEDGICVIKEGDVSRTGGLFEARSFYPPYPTGYPEIGRNLHELKR